MLVRILGPLEIEVDGAPVGLGGPKQRILASALAATAGQVVSADALIEAGWGDDLPSDPTNALQYQVAQLRKLVEERPSSPRFLLTRAPGYVLDADVVATDAGRFAEHLAAGRAAFARDDLATAAREIDAGLALWRGPALVEHRELDLLRATAERLDARRDEARELQVDIALALGRHAELLAPLEQLTDEQPLHEGWWVRRMHALYRSGRQSDALRAAHDAREQLAEVGLAPGPELRDLEQRILGHDPTLSPTVTATATPDHLPVPPNRLIGRDVELDRLDRALDAARHVTVVGPGGAGKTRLAIEIGRRRLDEHPGGVWFVPLDGVSDPAVLVTDVGRRTAMREDPEHDVIDTLAAHLGGRATLLILDNCEHLVEAAARLVDALLARCPALTILATSQITLASAAETVLDLAPLAVPGSTGSIYDPIEEIAAVALFAERAAAAGVDTSRWGPDELAAVANIVVELDGMPLAVELAAARARSMSLGEIALGLQERFDLLGGGPRTAPERQRSLQGALGWSLGLLDDRSRDAVARLGVFVGGFDATDVAAVLGLSPATARDRLGDLIDRSLVQRGPDVAGSARHHLLESLRQHGLTTLGAELGDVRDAHLRHFADLGHVAPDGLRGGDQADWLVRLDAQYENLRAALVHSLDGGDPRLGVRLAAGVAAYWDWRGLLTDAVEWIGRLLDATADDVVGRSRLMGWRAYFAWELGDLDAARRLGEEAVAAARALGDPAELAHILSASVLVARSSGELDRARAEADEMRRLALDADEPWFVAWAESALATVALTAGRLDEAEELARRAIAGFESLDDEHGVAWGRLSRAQIELERARLDDANAQARAALAASARLGDDRSSSWALELLAESAHRQGDAVRAARLLDAAHPLRTTRGLTASPSKRAAVDRLADELATRSDPPEHHGPVDPQRVIEDELRGVRSEP
ncbi:MAG: BTAD domain-containing putative transcriptional regulator [Actinomycetota bacterium]